MFPQAVLLCMCVYCVVIQILTHHASWEETNVFRITLSPWVDSGTYSGTSSLSLPTSDWNRSCLPPVGVAWRSISPNRQVVTTLQCINLAFCSTHIKGITYSHITVLGPVTWLCQLKCWIFLDRQPSPAHDSPAQHSLDNHLFKQRNHSFTAQCQTEGIIPLSGVARVSGLGPGFTCAQAAVCGFIKTHLSNYTLL